MPARDPQKILDSLLDAAKRAGRRCRRRAVGGKCLRQRLLPAGQAGGCRAQRKRRSGPARLCRQAGGLRLLHRFFRRRAGRPARARHRHGEAGAGRQIRRPGARRTGWREPFPRSTWKTRTSPRRKSWSRAPATPKRAALAVNGVTNSEGGGASFSRSRRRAGHQRRVSTAAMPAPATASASPCWPAKAPAWSATMTMPAPAMPATCASAEDDRPQRRRTRRARGSIPRKVKSQSVPVVFDPREAAGLLGHFAGAISGAAIARGVSFLKDRMGEADFRARHHHHRRSASPARPALQAVRRRRRRQRSAAP